MQPLDRLFRALAPLLGAASACGLAWGVGLAFRPGAPAPASEPAASPAPVVHRLLGPSTIERLRDVDGDGIPELLVTGGDGAASSWAAVLSGRDLSVRRRGAVRAPRRL